MGTRRKKTGVGAVERAIYDIFGNVIGQTSTTPPAAVAPAPPAPRPAVTRVVVGKTTADAVEKAESLYASAPSQVDRKRSREMAVVLDENGNVVTTLNGTQHAVTLRFAPGESARAAHITHNHPDVVTLSNTDIKRLSDMNLLSIQAQAIPMTDSEYVLLGAALDVIMDDPRLFIGHLSSNPVLQSALKEAIEQMHDLMQNAPPNARNFTHTAAIDGTQGTVTRQQRQQVGDVASKMAQYFRAFIPHTSRSLNSRLVVEQWIKLVNKALVRAGKGIPMTRNAATGKLEPDQNALTTSANFLVNAIGQHLVLHAAWSMHAPNDATYSTTLT
jgi:hypothetical protein